MKGCNLHSKRKVATIDDLERIGLRNNVNWLNLVWLAFITAPSQAEVIISHINIDEQEIPDLHGKCSSIRYGFGDQICGYPER